MSNRISEFLQCLAPVYVIFQLICLAPPLSPGRCKQIAFTAYALVTVGAVLFAAVTFVLGFRTIYLDADFTNRAVILMIIAAYLIVVLEAVFTQREHRRLLNALFAFDFTLYRTGLITAASRKWNVYGMFALSLSFFVLGASLHYGYRIDQFLWPLLVVGLGKMAVYSRVIQCTFYVDMVNGRLLMINEVLLMVGDAADGERQLALRALMTVRTLHGKLSEVAQAINGSFGWSLMAITLESIMDLVNCGHIFYLNVTLHGRKYMIIGTYSHNEVIRVW